MWGSFASEHHRPLSRGWLLRTAAAGVGITLAVCTKWTGSSAIAMAGLHSLLCLGRGLTAAVSRRGLRVGLRAAAPMLFAEAVARLLLLLLLPAVCYVLSFAAHFALLPLTGPGVGFMTPCFRATLINDTHIRYPTTIERVTCLGELSDC